MTENIFSLFKSRFKFAVKKKIHRQGAKAQRISEFINFLSLKD